jgi:hypothetical protein
MRTLLLVLAFACAVSPCFGEPSAANPVAAKLAELQARADVDTSVRGGWTIVTENGGLTIWYFTPPIHPAHPAYVKRWMFQKDGAWYQDMNVMCGSTTTICDALVAEFRQLNEQMRDAIQKSKGK